MNATVYSQPADAQGFSSSSNSLNYLFRPRSIVLYGASDNSSWSYSIYSATKSAGFTGKMYAVNRRGAEAHGMPGYTSAREISEEIDAAYVYVPIDGVFDAIEDLGLAGVKAAVVLTSGFAETGADGEELQSQLVSVAEKHGMQLLGPNSLGYANLAEGKAITSIPSLQPLRVGEVALVSQSGAICSEIADYAYQQGVGLSFFAATGNEAMVDIASVTDFLVDDPNTRVIAIFAEMIRSPDRFLAAADRALANHKPIVILKVGTSEISAAVAKAHTGSLVGDDRAFEAACMQHGVIRVESIEELITTAGVLGHVGVLEKPGVGLVSISGGGCGLFGDAAEKAGVTVPSFAPETEKALQEVQSSYGTILNPFDITGAAVADPSMFEKCLDIIGRDPSIGITLCALSMPTSPERATAVMRMLTPVGAALGRLGSKGMLLNATVKPLNESARQAIEEAGIPSAAGGIEYVVRALGKASWWSERVRNPKERASVQSIAKYTGERPESEREVLDYLEQFNVPVIPAVTVKTAEEAATAARSMGGPVALKISSPDIQHKSDIGGVRLGVDGDDAVMTATDGILGSVRQASPNARIDGVIVSPMREKGVELLVGTVRDALWGPVIVVGLGGVWVEVLKDTALRLLPVSRDDVLEMLGSLKSIKLLQGFRGQPAADLEAVADAIVGVGNAALALGDQLEALEINPLRVAGSEVEALDGLAVWKDSEAKS